MREKEWNIPVLKKGETLQGGRGGVQKRSFILIMGGGGSDLQGKSISHGYIVRKERGTVLAKKRRGRTYQKRGDLRGIGKPALLSEHLGSKVDTGNEKGVENIKK